MTRRSLLRMLHFPLIDQPDAEPIQRRFLLLTSGRSWQFRVWGVFSDRVPLERARKRIDAAHRAAAIPCPYWNPPVECTLDEPMQLLLYL